MSVSLFFQIFFTQEKRLLYIFAGQRGREFLRYYMQWCWSEFNLMTKLLKACKTFFILSNFRTFFFLSFSDFITYNVDTHEISFIYDGSKKESDQGITAFLFYNYYSSRCWFNDIYEFCSSTLLFLYLQFLQQVLLREQQLILDLTKFTYYL